eukprot:GFUD01054133.1.p1 GENE.GFUD01054133.1~~GFUD01054133.1.p1  ORF type:complete len:279 (-),score=46.13 GFUD01054133.1:47-883(-)
MPSMPNIDQSILCSYLPSQDQLADASESVLTSAIWLGQISLQQMKRGGVWLLQNCQDLYDVDWKQISSDDISVENALQLLTFEVLAGIFVLFLFLLLIIINKKWKWNQKTSENKTSQKNSKIKKIYQEKQVKEPLKTNVSKMYIWMQTLMSKIPLLNKTDQKTQQLTNKEKQSTISTKNTQQIKKEKKDGMFSFFKAEKPKPQSLSGGHVHFRTEEIEDSLCRGNVNRLSQFEPGKINAKLTNIFERKSPPLQLQKPPRLRIVTPDQVFRKNFYDQES